MVDKTLKRLKKKSLKLKINSKGGMFNNKFKTDDILRSMSEEFSNKFSSISEEISTLNTKVDDLNTKFDNLNEHILLLTDTLYNKAKDRENNNLLLTKNLYNSAKKREEIFEPLDELEPIKEESNQEKL